MLFYFSATEGKVVGAFQLLTGKLLFSRMRKTFPNTSEFFRDSIRLLLPSFGKKFSECAEAGIRGAKQA